MNKCFLLVCLSTCFLNPLFSQNTEVKNTLDQKVNDSIMAAHKDSIKWTKLASLAYFPLIKAGTFSGVLPVEGVDEIPSPKRQYK